MRERDAHLLAPGVAVVAHYEPEIFIAERIGRDLTQIVRSLKLKFIGSGAWIAAEWFDCDTTAEVRAPATSSDGRTDWHRDNGSRLLKDVALALWSNREQTEIQTIKGEILRPVSGDVLLVHNFRIFHRRPEIFSRDRWFFRQNVKAPLWLQK